MRYENISNFSILDLSSGKSSIFELDNNPVIFLYDSIVLLSAKNASEMVLIMISTKGRNSKSVSGLSLLNSSKSNREYLNNSMPYIAQVKAMIITRAINMVYPKSLMISMNTTISFWVAMIYFKKLMKLMNTINRVNMIAIIVVLSGNVLDSSK